VHANPTPSNTTPIKAYGAFTNPGDNLNRINAASSPRGVSVVEEPEPDGRENIET